MHQKAAHHRRPQLAGRIRQIATEYIFAASMHEIKNQTEEEASSRISA